MAEHRIAITGATGFVGCRLAERLLLAGGYRIAGLVRQFSGPGLARLARLPIEIVRADVMDPERLEGALEGCRAVVHCAYGTSGTPEERHRVTVEGTRNVLRAAMRSGVDRVIHMSSAAVHGTGGDRDRIDESAPFTSDPGDYEAAKIDAERVVWDIHREHGLPVVVFRPPLIYGPHGRRWTVRIVEEIAGGGLLVNGGAGAANLVYVDNLVDGILRSIETGAGDGEAFFMVDDEALTWRDVYEAYAGLLPDAPPLREMSVVEIERLRREREPGWVRASLVLPMQLLPSLARASVGPQTVRDEMKRIPWVRALKEALPEPLVERLKGDAPDRQTASSGREENGGRGDGGPAARTGRLGQHPPSKLPDPALIELLTSRTRFDNTKAKRVLGHEQRIGFAEAIRRIGAWLRYQRIGRLGDPVGPASPPAPPAWPADPASEPVG